MLLGLRLQVGNHPVQWTQVPLQLGTQYGPCVKLFKAVNLPDNVSYVSFQKFAAHVKYLSLYARFGQWKLSCHAGSCETSAVSE